jgi:predicted dehydrogenase
METLRVGFIGLGGICRQRHLPGLMRIPGVDLVAVSNRSRASSEAAAKEFGFASVHDDWHEIIAREDIDAVFIGTWPYMHREMSVAALKAGKHVFCQARMAMNLGGALEMRAAARAAGRVAMLCPVPFGLSVGKTVARLLAEGAVGSPRIIAVRSFSGAWRDPEAPANWRKDHRLSGLNMQTLGMYAEVLHRWFGPTRALVAEALTVTPARRDGAGAPLDVQIPDQVSVTARMDGGLTAQYLISGLMARPCERIEIFGDAGALDYDIDTETLWRVDPDGGRTVVEIPPDEAYDVKQWRVEEDFINAVRHGAEYHPDFEDGVRYMRFVQAVHDSAAAGAVVALDDDHPGAK